MDTIKLFQIDEKLLPDAYRLYQEVLNGKDDLDTFSAKYALSDGKGKCSVIAYDGIEAIGFFGVLGYSFLFENKIVYCGMGCDFAIKKAYRGKGIFAQMTTIVKSLATAAGYLCIYGLQSEISNNATKKNGWQTTKTQIVYFKLTEGERLFLSKLNTIRKKITGSSLPLHFKKYVDYQRKLPDMVVNENHSIQLDEQFVAYKTFHQNYFLKLSGCTFWVRFQQYVEICYTHYNHITHLENALKIIKTCAHNSGLKGVVIYTNTDTPLYEYLTSVQKAQQAWTTSVLPINQAESCIQLRAQAFENDGF